MGHPLSTSQNGCGPDGAFPLSILMPLSPRRVPPHAVRSPGQPTCCPRPHSSEQLDASSAQRPRIPSPSSPRSAATRRVRCRSASRARQAPAAGSQFPNEKALERIIAELPSKPFLVGEEGVSMSLAGVQNKLGVSIDAKGRICVPHDGAPSTHILKPDSESLFGGVQNEALCLTLARALRPQRRARDNGQGRQAHLPAGHALRPRRTERTVAPAAPGGFLPGARKAAGRPSTRRTRPASRDRPRPTCSH